MTFNKDTLWLEAKQIAKESGLDGNWIEIIDYYNSSGGQHVLIHIIFEQSKRRILRILDNEEVLLIDANGDVSAHNYNMVMESNKLFFYKENAMKETRISLPEGYTLRGLPYVEVNV